jgi:hypothetical protein
MCLVTAFDHHASSPCTVVAAMTMTGLQYLWTSTALENLKLNRPTTAGWSGESHGSHSIQLVWARQNFSCSLHVDSVQAERPSAASFHDSGRVEIARGSMSVSATMSGFVGLSSTVMNRLVL